MSRWSLHRSDLLWLGVILAAVAMHWLLPDFRADLPTDSFRTGPRGKKALYLLADRLDYVVSRNFESLANFTRRFAGAEDDVVLLLLGPARNPSTREWEALASFVEAGGGLVFAPSSDDPAFEAVPFQISEKELDRTLDVDGKKNPLQVDLGGLKGNFSWQSRGELRAPGDTKLVVADGTVQGVAQRRGFGTAIFVATDRPFDNVSLTWPDNAVLAFRLLEAAGYRGTAIFDESLNVSGTPKVVELLLDRPLRSFTLHVFVVLGIFGWWRSRRFGPLLPPSALTRSDIVAHADAVGMLHYKTRDGRAALRDYLHQLMRQLKLVKLRGVREERVLDPIARRLNRSTDDVRKVFRQANAALKKEKLDRPTAAKLIRRLAKIRRAAGRAGERGGVGIAARHESNRTSFQSTTMTALALSLGLLSLGAVQNEAGFTPLFPQDGVPQGWSVRQWDDVSKPAAEGVVWKVEDGLLHGSDPRGTWLVSDKEYGDFELRFEWKIPERGNGGLGLRFPSKGDPAFDGLELQMVDPRYYGDAASEIPPTELTGGLYRAVAPWDQRYQPGEWNEYVVRLEGPHVTVKLNGETIQKVNLDEEAIPVTRHDGSPAPPLKERPRKGHIGFQELSRGGGHVMIRNARIKELSSEPRP